MAAPPKSNRAGRPDDDLPHACSREFAAHPANKFGIEDSLNSRGAGLHRHRTQKCHAVFGSMLNKGYGARVRQNVRRSIWRRYAMISFGPLTRAIALAGLLLSASAAAVPALAAPADIALLQSYIGEWRGRGVLIGATQESVVCRLSLSQGNQDKINYNGRCTLAGTTLSVAGTMAYVDANKRFEAVMSSNATFNGIAVGQKRGQSLIFNLREREKDEEGKDLNISSQITLSKEAIQVVFEVVYVESGDSLRAEVPFSR